MGLAYPIKQVQENKRKIRALSAAWLKMKRGCLLRKSSRVGTNEGVDGGDERTMDAVMKDVAAPAGALAAGTPERSSLDATAVPSGSGPGSASQSTEVFAPAAIPILIANAGETSSPVRTGIHSVDVEFSSLDLYDESPEFGDKNNDTMGTNRR